MNENKRQIIIDVPEGYETCEQIEDATHVLVDGRDVCKLQGSQDEFKWLADPFTQGIHAYVNRFGPRITAYLREVPKPEPFQLVLEDCNIDTNFDIESDYTWVRITMDGISKLDFERNTKYRVTIEKETEEETNERNY